MLNRSKFKQERSLVNFVCKLFGEVVVFVIDRFCEIHVFPLVDVEVLEFVFAFAYPDFVLFVVLESLVHSAWGDGYRLRAACNCMRSSMML